MLKRPWKEAEDSVIELPDIEPKVFEVFGDWLYTQRVLQNHDNWIAPSDKPKSISNEHTQKVELLLIKSYVFADHFLVTHLRVAIYKFLACQLTKRRDSPFHETIIFAFDNLPSTSAMLNLLARFHCAFWTEIDDTKNGNIDKCQELPFDFLLRVMVYSSKYRDHWAAERNVHCKCHSTWLSTGREGCDVCMPLPLPQGEGSAVEKSCKQAFKWSK